MSNSEIILTVILCAAFLLSAVCEKVFRRNLRLDAKAIKDGREPANLGHHERVRIAFSLLSCGCAAAVFIVLIVTGASHTVQLAAVLAMLLALVI